jgi:hypothetical protein
MIPTRYRSKLPKSLSYPVGAELISTALAGSAHIASLSVRFCSHAVEPASRFQRILSERLPYRSFLAEYDPARKPGLSAADFMIERGWYEERWELTVYPVLREFRHTANQLLRDQGLPAVVTWLGKAEGLARGIVPQQLELMFNPADGTLAVVEGGRYKDSRV